MKTKVEDDDDYHDPIMIILTQEHAEVKSIRRQINRDQGQIATCGTSTGNETPNTRDDVMTSRRGEETGNREGNTRR